MAESACIPAAVVRFVCAEGYFFAPTNQECSKTRVVASARQAVFQRRRSQGRESTLAIRNGISWVVSAPITFPEVSFYLRNRQ